MPRAHAAADRSLFGLLRALTVPQAWALWGCGDRGDRRERDVRRMGAIFSR
jgi:hypothetical protein